MKSIIRKIVSFMAIILAMVFAHVTSTTTPSTTITTTTITTTTAKFRLKQFDYQANDGVAQILYNGTWGAVDILVSTPVQYYADYSAKALCNSIGYGYEGFATSNIHYKGNFGFLLTWITEFTCTSFQRFATECVNETSIRLRNTTISSILHCYAFQVTDIRLSGGVIPSEGLLEARISNRWGAVRYISRYNWKDAFDDLICRTLGYIEESVIQPTRYGPEYAIITITSTYQCPNLTSIFNITRLCSTEKGWTGSEYDNLYKEINCRPIRLVDGPSALDGRVEAGLFGQLRSICGLGFDEHAANVTCTSLGFSAVANFNLKTIYGAGILSMYSRKISCSGQERSLEQCIHSDTDIIECGIGDVVSVACFGGPVKLERFNENRIYEGLFTAYYGGHWYNVLTKVTDITARTLCSMLGYGSVGFSSLSRYSKNVYYYKSGLSCYGNESYIEECLGDFQYCVTQGYYYCYDFSSRSGLLALFCSDYEIQRITLLNGVIELAINNETWSVCEDYFTADAASSVCRILGYTGHTSYSFAPVQSSDSTIIGGLTCESGATTLPECKLKHQYSYRPYAQGQACSNRISLECNNECRQGYFGSNCTKCLCKSVNSLSCHNITGACTCKQGWSGTTCSDDVNECLVATDICNEPSVCVNTAGAYFCQCPVGMYMKDTADGGTCEVCSNNTYGINCISTCTCNAMNTYISDQMCEPKTGQCFCKPEWRGLSCDIDVNECVVSANVVCQQPHTECINKEGGYTCDCIEGFKNENETCVPIPSAENSNWTTLVIASAVGGSVGIIVIVAVVVVCCLRRHREKPDGKPKASRKKQIISRSGEVYTDGTHNVIVLCESGDYSVLNEAKRRDGSYPRRQNEDVASHKHTEPSRSHNNPYDIIENVNMRNLKSEDMVSDGYLTPQPGRNDDKYVSDGYLKPMMQKPTMSGDYLKPERTNYQTHEYLKIKYCQEDHGSDGDNHTGRNSNLS